MGIIITELGPSQSELSNPFLMMLTVAAFPGHPVHLSGSRFGTALQRQGLSARGALCTFRHEFCMQSELHRGVAGTAICMHNFDSIRVADEKLAAKSHAAAVQRSGHRQHAPSTHGFGPERIVAGLFDFIFARSVPRSISHAGTRFAGVDSLVSQLIGAIPFVCAHLCTADPDHFDLSSLGSTHGSAACVMRADAVTPPSAVKGAAPPGQSWISEGFPPILTLTNCCLSALAAVAIGIPVLGGLFVSQLTQESIVTWCVCCCEEPKPP